MTGLVLRGARDPRGSTRLLGWTSPGLAQVEHWNADQAFRYGYLANVIAYRCIQLRANALAAVPFVAGRRLDDAKTIRENAPLAKLLGVPPGGPAPKLSARKLFRWTVAQKIVTGRYAWEIETDGRGVPVAFWPMASTALKATPSAGGTEWFRLFEYGLGADPVKFKPDQVFYSWEPSGQDFRQAESPLEAARWNLSLVQLCDRYGVSFLKNNAVPAAIITTTAFPNDELRRGFRQQWSSEFEGADNAGRTMFNEVGDDGDGPVGESIDVKVLGLSAKDARLIEQRIEATKEIAIALGTPWSKLDASGRTFDNADAEDRDWWENTILPDLCDLQDEINMQLAPRLGSEVGWFDLRGVRALQRRYLPIAAADLPTLVQGGILVKNEARSELGYEPVDGGDEFTEPVGRQAGHGGLAPPPAANDPSLNGDQPARATEPENRMPDPAAIEARRARVWHAADATVRSLEARWQRSIARLLHRQEESVLARLRGKRGRQALGYGTDGQPLAERRDSTPGPIDPEELFSSEFWTAETADVAQSLFEDVALAAGTRLSTAFGIAFDVSSPWAQQFITDRVNQLAPTVTATTRDAITAQLAEGVGAGESIDQLAERIRSLFQQTYASRAETVARTEVIGAYNGASVLGAAQLPADVVAAQEWIATRDGRTREAHASADGQTVGIGTAFLVGGHQMAYPGDPNGGASNTVNCRCTVAFLTPEEWQAMTDRARLTVEARTAKALLAAVQRGDEFDLLGFRRAIEEVATCPAA